MCSYCAFLPVIASPYGNVLCKLSSTYECLCYCQLYYPTYAQPYPYLPLVDMA